MRAAHGVAGGVLQRATLGYECEKDTSMGQAEQRADTEFTEGHIEVGGFRIQYMEAGQGSSVVMLHGMGGLILTRLHNELAKKVPRAWRLRYRASANRLSTPRRSPCRIWRGRWRRQRHSWG